MEMQIQMNVIDREDPVFPEMYARQLKAVFSILAHSAAKKHVGDSANEPTEGEGLREVS